MDTSELIPKIESVAPGAVLEIRPFGRSAEISIWIEMRAIQQVAQLLRFDPDFELNLLENLSVMELDRALVFTYFLRAAKKQELIIVRGTVAITGADDEIEVDSVQGVWPMARPLEKEISELFGVKFKGTKWIAEEGNLLPENWLGYPLRKAYVFPAEVDGAIHLRPVGRTAPDEHEVKI